jgi:hypothetical protein
VLLMLYHEHRQHPFPVPPDLLFVSKEMAEAYAIRAEAARRLTDPAYRDLRPQLRQVIAMFDKWYGGRFIGMEPV